MTFHEFQTGLAESVLTCYYYLGGLVQSVTDSLQCGLPTMMQSAYHLQLFLKLKVQEYIFLRYVEYIPVVKNICRRYQILQSTNAVEILFTLSLVSKLY